MFRDQPESGHPLAVVGGEYHNGVVLLAAFLQSLQNFADLPVRHADVLRVGVQIEAVPFRRPVRGLPLAGMGAADVPHRQRAAPEIVAAEVRGERRQLLRLRQRQSVVFADELADVVRVVQIRNREERPAAAGIVFQVFHHFSGGVHVVETVIVHREFGAEFAHRAEFVALKAAQHSGVVLFAEMHGLVARLGKHFAERRMRGLPRRLQIGHHIGFVRISPAPHRGARRHAQRADRVSPRETLRLLQQPVEVRSRGETGGVKRRCARGKLVADDQ